MIRPTTLKDAKEIAQVHIQTWRAGYAGIVSDAYLQSLSITKKTERWQEILSKPSVRESNNILWSRQ